LQQVGYGYGSATGDLEHALLWTGTAASKVDLNPANFYGSRALSTNGMQQVGYGQCATAGGNDHALLWSGTSASAVDLHSLLPAGYNYSRAQSIDAAGNIVGYAENASGAHAIMWVVVPEPSTFVLVGMGVLGFFGFCWRWRK
jgi:uncharacterized membrane protein